MRIMWKLSLMKTAIMSSASLLGCSVQGLRLALSICEIQDGKDKVAKKLTLDQAVDRRDALAKFIYATLFDWLVEALNNSLDMGKQSTGRSISILDIYGFESFQNNTFEQLCINYANERLHQHFIRHLLKHEQEEYEMDGIDSTRVDFQDNQECLDLFEKKPNGLISLLEEELNFPEATDLTIAGKLKQHLNANPCFKGERNGAFRIHHYAGEVLYETSGFLEKNRDRIYCGTIQLLSSCSGRLAQLFACSVCNQFLKKASPLSQLAAMDPQKKGVVTDFKDRLFKLMQQLEKTVPHFIFCIKPNRKKLPGRFEQDLVLDQLKFSGILEVVKISKSGYPSRMTHQEFMRRYGFMLLEKNACQDPLNISVAVLKQFDVLPEMYQVGYTKLYFRVGQIDMLENMRKQLLLGKLDLQKCFHHHWTCHHFHEVKRAVIALQAFVRGENARRKVNKLKNLKEQVAHKTFEARMKAVIRIQSVIRGWLARKHFCHLGNLKRSDLYSSHSKQVRKVSEAKDLPKRHAEILPSVVEEFQRQVLMVDATLRQKEGENAALRKQLQLFEAQLSEYEAKMKSVEEMWQKQMASLKMNLSAANNSLSADSTCSHGSSLIRCCDSEDTMAMLTRTGASTPIKCSDDVLNIGVGQVTNGSLNPVSCLQKEFEQQKHNFNAEAKALVEVKSGHSSSMNPVEELRRLKQRFKAWKKEYKVQLRQAKTKLRKNGYSELEKGLRKWFGKKNNAL